MKNKNVIAILGGMGPEASAKMLEVMISMASKDFGAKNGEDFPEIILDSIPVPDFISNKENIDSALNMLSERVEKLEEFGVTHFAMACNTAHIIFGKLSSKTSVPFISIIAATSIEIANQNFQRVGLLATPSTIKAGMYQKALKELGIKIIEPDKVQLKQLEIIIRRVIAGTSTAADSRTLKFMAMDLKSKGAEGIILGCTELPLIFPNKFPLPVFDTIEVLSRALLRRVFAQKAKKKLEKNKIARNKKNS